MVSKKMFFAVGMAALLFIQGCAIQPWREQSVIDRTDHTVIRMWVSWNEKPDHAYAPAIYSVQGKFLHWGPNAIQYRWMPMEAHLRRDSYANVRLTARIPDNIPLLSYGDLVDVYARTEDDVNYNELRSSVVLALVCRAKDKECIKRSTKELGGVNEIVSKDTPDMSGLSFTKLFDETGALLKR